MISFVQLAQTFAFTGNSAVASLTGVAKGDLLLAFIQVANFSVTGITDDQGNAWTIVKNQHASEVGTPFNIVSAWAIAKAAGACNVTWALTGSGGFPPFGTVVEVATTNSWATNPISASGYADCNGGNPNTPGPMAGASVGSYVIAWGSLYSTGTVWAASTSGFTLRTGGAANSVMGVCDSTSQPAGSVTPDMTLTINQNTFALGFVVDEVKPAQTLSPQASQIQIPAYTIMPIEEE